MLKRIPVFREPRTTVGCYVINALRRQIRASGKIALRKY
jgi:hypothetical protein